MNKLKLWKVRILMILAVVGPGFITANVDNDAGGIWTYSQTGAQFGYSLLWTMIPITIGLIVVQEMAARMGAVTGKGLSDLIREEFGFRTTFLLMVGLVIVNFGNVVTEFIGIKESLSLFGIPAWASVPVCAFIVWFMVVKGSYKVVEKIFLVASFVYFAYIIAGFMAHPAWKHSMLETLTPPSFAEFRDEAYIYTIIGLVGTTIAPWMQFYLQSSVVEKGVSAKEYATSRLDVIFGCLFTDLVAWFIIVACAATLYAHGLRDVKSASEAAQALQPLAGQYAYILFSFGLFNASLFAASILPISTSYTVCEGLGFESGLDKKFEEAPFFYWLYTVLIVIGAGVVLIPQIPSVKVSILSQVVNGVVLPMVLIPMLILVNRRDLMGKHVNSRLFNVIAIVTTAVVILLSAFYAVGLITGKAH